MTEIEIRKVIGMDYEPSDTDVGIMSASFCISVKDDSDNQHDLIFGEDEFIELLEILKPHCERMGEQND